MAEGWIIFPIITTFHDDLSTMMSSAFFVLLLDAAMLWPRSWAAAPQPPLAVSLQKRATSKAGLAWADGQYIDMNQYTSSGKVSWYGFWLPVLRASVEV